MEPLPQPQPEPSRPQPASSRPVPAGATLQRPGSGARLTAVLCLAAGLTWLATSRFPGGLAVREAPAPASPAAVAQGDKTAADELAALEPAPARASCPRVASFDPDFPRGRFTPLPASWEAKSTFDVFKPRKEAFGETPSTFPDDLPDPCGSRPSGSR